MKSIGYEIRKVKVSDLDDLLSILNENWSSAHFTSFFSEKQMKKYLICMITKNKYGFVISETTELSKKVIGFIIAGITTDRAVDSYLKENFLYVFMIMLKHPKFLFEKIYFLFRKVLGKKETNSSADVFGYLLAKYKITKVKWVAEKLYNHLEKEIVKDGYTSHCFSVRKENPDVINYYNKMGYKIISENKYSVTYLKQVQI